MTKEQLLKQCNGYISANKEFAKLLPNKTMMRKIIDTRKISSNDMINLEYSVLKYSEYQIGDILWIREPVEIIFNHKIDDSIYDSSNIKYIGSGTLETYFQIPNKYRNKKWFLKCKGIPNGCIKEMARYFVRIISIRIKRLQDISFGDIVKEGYDIGKVHRTKGALNWWIALWNSTATKEYKWENNPYVFVYEWEYLDYDN